MTRGSAGPRGSADTGASWSAAAPRSSRRTADGGQALHPRGCPAASSWLHIAPHPSLSPKGGEGTLRPSHPHESRKSQKMILGVIPAKTIWEYKFPFYIRTAGKAWTLSEQILELVLESVKDCTTIHGLTKRLIHDTVHLLKDYVDQNELQAHMMGVEKLGTVGAKKSIEGSPTIRDVVAIPSEVIYIIGDYGAVLAERSEPIQPISKLPHPKETIEHAFKVALGIAKDEKMRAHLRTCLLALDDFVPDEEVSRMRANPGARLEAWIKRLAQINSEFP